MNTKGVEDGMSDEQATDRCIHCSELPADHRGLPGSPLCPKEGRKPFSEGEWRTTRYETSAPVAQPAVPVEERTATGLKVEYPTREQCYERAMGLIHKLRPDGCFGDEEGYYADLEFYVMALRPPIPEERTAKELCERMNGDFAVRLMAFRRDLDAAGLHGHYSIFQKHFAHDISPEERTAEMEELGPAIIEAIGALRSSYNVQDFPGDGDTRQDHAANALERIWDHIEGKGK